MTFPLMLLVLVIVNGIVFICVSKFIQKRQVDLQFVRQRCLSFFLQSVISCYTLIIAGAVSPLICLEQPDGSQTMVRNPSIFCHTEEWNANFSVIVLFLVIYAGLFPLTLLVMLIMHRHRLHEPHMITLYGSFTRQYKANFYWWEMIFLTKRALFVTVSGMIPAHPGDSSPYFACIFLLFGYMGFEFFINPFKRTLTAKRSAMWNFIAILVLMSDGLVFKSNEPSQLVKYFWSTIMLILIVLAMATAFMSFFHAFRYQQRRTTVAVEMNTSTGVVEFEDPNKIMKLISLEGLEEVASFDIHELQKVSLTRKRFAGPIATETIVVTSETKVN
jgi:hypothetical protein